jgi:hypothetical protein
MPDKKFIQKAIKRPGALRKHFGVKKGETIPQNKLMSLIRRLQKKAKGKAKLSMTDSRLLKQALLAKTLKKLKK